MNNKTIKTDPYKIFAFVYDQEAHIEITSSFFNSLCSIVDFPQKLPVLDLGCGTGIMIEKLALLGQSVIGVDRSPEMLSIAIKRCKNFKGRIHFVKSDLAKLPRLKKCALAIACGDIINHLHSQRILKKVFEKVRNSLKPGGVFVFDTLNRFCFEQYWDNLTYFMESKNGDLVMNCTWDGIKGVGNTEMTVYVNSNNNNIYTKEKTHMSEYLYEEKEIYELLLSVGFLNISNEPWSPWSDQNLEPSLDRLLWIAKIPHE